MGVTEVPRRGYFAFLKRQFQLNKYVYLMLLPVMLYFMIFHYLPMAGIVLAFKDYSFQHDLWGNLFATPLVGFKHFINFFTGISFGRVVLNTVMINLYGLVFSFPAPIILALLLNELKPRQFKKMVQTITYMPHFISMVVVSGLIIDILSNHGLVNTFIAACGGKPIMFMVEPQWFRTIYISSDIWQNIGWGSIIYLAALAGIDPQLYEAAEIDGAGRLRKMVNITIPCLMPTIIILLILRIGQMMNVGAEKIILLYQPTTYETADVISSYVYRRGLLGQDFSFSTAVGLFNSIINFSLLFIANRMSKKITGNRLW